MAGRVEDASAGVGHVGDDVDHVKRIHETDGRFAVAFQAEGHHAARAVGEILLCQFVVGVALQTAIAHPGNTRVVLQKFCHTLCVLAMLRHAQMESLQPEVEDKRVHRCRNRAQVAHQLGHEFCGVAHFPERLHIGQSVIALVGRAKSGEFLCLCHPVEIAAVDHHAAHLARSSVHVFGGAVRHDVSSPFKWAAVYGSGKRVVNNQWHSVAVCQTCELLNVENGTSGVAHRFAKHSLRVRLEGLLQFLFTFVLVDERAVDAQFLERHAKEVVSATVDFVAGDDVVASLADVKHGIEIGRLTGPHAAFQLRDFFRHSVVGGVLQARIEIALLL